MSQRAAFLLALALVMALPAGILAAVWAEDGRMVFGGIFLSGIGAAMLLENATACRACAGAGRCHLDRHHSGLHSTRSGSQWRDEDT